MNSRTQKCIDLTKYDINHECSDECYTQGTSKRYNAGKVQLREISPAFILGIGEVLTKSREKYDEMNWAKKTDWSVPYESALRHLMAFQSGEDYDSESGQPHLLHCATNIMFLHYHFLNSPETDNRLFKKKKD